MGRTSPIVPNDVSKMVLNQMNINTTSLDEHLFKSNWRMHSRQYSFQLQLKLADSFLKTTTCCRIQAPRAPSLEPRTGFCNTSNRAPTARKVLLGEFIVVTAGSVDDLVRCNGSRVNDGKDAPLSFTPSTLTCQQLVVFKFVHAKCPSGKSFAKVFTARLEDGVLFGQIEQRIVTDTSKACLLMCWTGMFMRSMLASA